MLSIYRNRLALAAMIPQSVTPVIDNDGDTFTALDVLVRKRRFSAS